MKLILCSVFLAHGAVVYTVCAPVSGGLYQAPKQGGALTVILGNHEACDQGPLKCVKVQKEKDSHKTSDIKQKQRNRFSVSGASGIAKDDGGSSGITGWWQIDGDLSLKTERDITIHFTIDTRGNIQTVTVAPFTSDVYGKIFDQLKQIHFTWRGTISPPALTTFEKKICLR